VWSRPGVGKVQVFTTPLLDKSAGHRAQDAQEEAEKQHDIDANGVTSATIRGLQHLLTIAGEERLVYFDDK
jgi:hypothetical protein